MKMPSRGWIVTTVVAAAWLGFARPWTIRPIAGASHESFDARVYAGTIWDARVVPLLRSRAMPLAAVPAHTLAHATPVTIDGVVLDVDTSSRVGTAAVDLAPADGRPDALLMIGPVLRGTALRDALDFIRFTDFTNQIQFASVGTALNERALTSLKDVDPSTLKRRDVHVLGVAWRDAGRPDSLPFVVPVQCSLGDPR